jgi:DNA-binding IclR family transcriptional regulator
VRGVSVAVRDYSKNVIAAIGISAPASRLTDERLEKGGILDLLRESGQALSMKLGFITAVKK